MTANNQFAEDGDGAMSLADRYALLVGRSRYDGAVNRGAENKMDRVASLVADLSSSEAEVRDAAADALCNLGQEARPAFPALLDALLKEHGACPAVGNAIVELGPTTEDLPKLRLALQHSNDHVRFWAARAAVKLGPAAEPLLDDLIPLLLDDHHPVTDSVFWALSTIGEAAIPRLTAIAVEEDSIPLRAQAIVALQGFKQQADRVLPILRQALRNNDPQIRSAASRAICGLGYPEEAVQSNVVDLENRCP